MPGDKGDVVVWYHWHSFISEVILLLCVWTVENQRQLVVQLQLWPHHLHTEICWIFPSPSLSLSLSSSFFVGCLCSFPGFVQFLVPSLFFFFFFPRMPDVASRSQILFFVCCQPPPRSLQSAVTTACNLSNITITAESLFFLFFFCFFCKSLSLRLGDLCLLAESR